MRSATDFLPLDMIDVHEFGNFLIAELGIRQDFTFGDFATTGHNNLSLYLVKLGRLRIRPFSGAWRRTSNATAYDP
jgi:hypothetical protein